jgi:hypothetical protein
LGLSPAAAVTAVGANTIFGAISGSAPATVAALVNILYDSLIDSNTPRSFRWPDHLVSRNRPDYTPSICMVLLRDAKTHDRQAVYCRVIPGYCLLFHMRSTAFLLPKVVKFSN